MNSSFDVNSYSPLRRQAPKKISKPVNFMYAAPQAQVVAVVGDFNGWNAQASQLKRMPDGTWMTTLDLPHGHHRYMFMVDNQPHLDPRAQGVTRNDQNERVSLLAVS
jgi:1,4-alpha-glucan branching enzyme